MAVDLKIRAWDKVDYIAILRRLGAKAGAEIGVYNGDMTRLFLKWLPNCSLYLIDPWRQLPVEEYDDLASDCDEIQEARYQLVKTLVKDYPDSVLIRKRSREAIDDIPDNSLDFVYIDANHKPDEVLFDIENWSKKVREGGVVSGHDFDFEHLYLAQTVINYCAAGQVKELLLCKADNIWLFKKGEL